MDNRLPSLIARFRESLPARRRVLLGGCLLGGVLLLFALSSSHVSSPTHQVAPYKSGRDGKNGEALWPNGVGPMAVAPKEAYMAAPLRVPYGGYKTVPGDSADPFREPQIAYSAELSVVTREFTHSRSRLEEILDRHRGYVAKLRMVGQPSESILSATLRVPSTEYRSALTELKTVGMVEREEESADEITQQHSELEARLVNAQNEERRIQQLLQDRSAKVADVEALTRQVELLRSEIERIEAERYASGSRVSFANVFFTMREEPIPVAETIGAKLRAAAVGGLSDALESVSAILLFLAGHGPLLALWAVLIYFPARFLWRRYGRAPALGSSLGA
jgi:uncharacterized small protein (DUF1192 family)